MHPILLIACKDEPRRTSERSDEEQQSNLKGTPSLGALLFQATALDVGMCRDQESWAT
jgi:hypothetical protein